MILAVVVYFSKLRVVGGYLFMKFFLSFFCCLLSALSICLCPVSVLADGAGTGDSVSIGIDFSATSATGSETVNNYLWGEFVAEWMDEDDTTFTVYDFMSRLTDAYISYQYAVPSGGASVLKNAIFDTIRDYTFYVDSQSGVVKAPSEFYHDLEEIYKRFGFDEEQLHIGNWYALPVSFVNNSNVNTSISQSAGDATIYFAWVSGGSSYFAVRGLENNDCFYVRTMGGTTYNPVRVSSAITDSSYYYKGYVSSIGIRPNNSSSYTPYSSTADAYADFFGNTPESGDLVWNGNLYYDNTPNSFTLNNAQGGTTDAANRYSLLTYLDVEPDDTNLHQYFDGDTTIIYNPNFSDIPNNHDFSYELPSGTMPDLDFDFNYTLAPDDNGIMTPFDEPFTYGFFAVALLALGVFLLIEVMT